MQSIGPDPIESQIAVYLREFDVAEADCAVERPARAPALSSAPRMSASHTSLTCQERALMTNASVSMRNRTAEVRL